jgi:hypothetical protein
MLNWIKTSDRLPPLRKRVLIWTDDSRLMGWDGKLVHVFVMERIPQQTYGNHILPYSWSCENSGWEYGHNVTHWAEIEGPNG